MRKLFTQKNILKVLFFSAVLCTLFLVLVPHTAEAQSVSCGVNVGCHFKTVILTLLQSYMYAVMSVFAFILYLCGLFMDHVLMFTVVGMRDNVEAISAINVIWKLFRDLANMFFIFALTYAGIATILGIKSVQWRTYLRNIIIAGLLINFSLFITKVPIDISNILSLQFYRAAVTDSGSKGSSLPTTGGSFTFAEGTLSGAFMNYLRIQAIYKPTTPGNLSTEATNFIKDLANLMITTIFGSTIMLIVSCVFLAIACMFLYRFFILIYVMIISPLFFLGIILPKVAGEYGEKWKKNLIEQCLFAPILFLLLWISLQFMKGLQGITRVGPEGFNPATANNASLFGGIASLIINYALIIAMILGSLYAARQAGAKGGEALDKKASAMPGAVGKFMYRQSAGRAASGLQNSNMAKRLATWQPKQYDRNTFMGKVARYTGAGLVTDSLGKGVRETTRAAQGGLGEAEGAFGGYKKTKEAQEKADREARVAYEEVGRKQKVANLERDHSKYKEYIAQVDKAEKKDTDTVVNGITGTTMTVAELRKLADTAKADYKKEVADMRSGELSKLETKEVMEIADLLTQKQVDEFMGDKSQLTDAEKQKLKDARKDMLDNELKSFEGRVAAVKASKDGTEAEKAAKAAEIKRLDRQFTDFITGTSAAQIAGANIDFLLNEEVLKRLDSEDAKKIFEKRITKTTKDIEGIENGTPFYEAFENRVHEMEAAGTKTKLGSYFMTKDVAGILQHDPEEAKGLIEDFRKKAKDAADKAEKEKEEAARTAAIRGALRKDTDLVGKKERSENMADGVEKDARALAEKLEENRREAKEKEERADAARKEELKKRGEKARKDLQDAEAKLAEVERETGNLGRTEGAAPYDLNT